LLLQQAIEELHRDRSKFAKALLQEQSALARIVGGMMALDELPCAALRIGHEPMPGQNSSLPVEIHDIQREMHTQGMNPRTRN